MAPSLAVRLQRLAALHPERDALAAVLAGRSGVASSGFPFVAATSFRLFLNEVPHLFRDAGRLLRWLGTIEKRAAASPAITAAERAAVARAAAVLRTVAYSAAVCAPSDLWLLRHVLSAHRRAGTLAWLAAGRSLECFGYARAHGLDPSQLRFDCQFLHSRGYLRQGGGAFALAAHPCAHSVATGAAELPPELAADLTGPLLAVLGGSRAAADSRLIQRLYLAPLPPRTARTGSAPGWVAGLAEIETGFRLVPLALALRALGLSGRLPVGAPAQRALPKTAAVRAVLHCLAATGVVSPAGKVTELGARVLARGPGPFGIIHAYHPYMTQLPELLSGGKPRAWVERGANVAASQDANRKTFELANASLDRFCAAHGFRYSVFVEHAVGRGEATRQRFAASGEARIRYFGADLEDAAINQALEAQQAGQLPRNMSFVRGADIGAPEVLLAALAAAGASAKGAVMLVGNGFHEIRGQTNERMIAVFRGYQAAGLVLVFTEESALSDADLLATGWNTYHAGFRYVHELSGQGLRPAADHDDASGRYSWRTCAAKAGYRVLREYTTRTRTIYPVPRRDGYNPAISMNYFCVPAALAAQLGLGADAVL